MFSYEVNPNDKHVSIKLKGDLDIEVTEIFEEIYGIVNPFTHIELDMEEVLFVDSTGIGLLMNLINSVKQNQEKTEIRMTNIQPLIRDVFEMLQLDKILGEDVFK